MSVKELEYLFLFWRKVVTEKETGAKSGKSRFTFSRCAKLHLEALNVSLTNSEKFDSPRDTETHLKYAWSELGRRPAVSCFPKPSL